MKKLKGIVMEDIYYEIAKVLEKKEKVALATLITRVGSAPRAVGAKYLIKGDGATSAPLEGDVLRQRSGKRLRRSWRKEKGGFSILT